MSKASEYSKKMALKEFVEKGYLQEVNRQFFHPLGLALYVRVDASQNIELEGIFDYRDDLEGVFFDPPPSFAKWNHVYFEAIRRMAPRSDKLGFWFQPVEKEGVEL